MVDVPDECLTPLFSADVTELPGLAGGTQHLTLTAGPEFALDFYLVLGSLSGTTPGFAVGALTLPLNVPDPYFNLTLQQPNSASLVDTFGVLSSQGTATASLNVPPRRAVPEPGEADLPPHLRGLRRRPGRGPGQQRDRAEAPALKLQP